MKVSAPATIANFGPGFDVFGLCLDAPKDIIRIKENDEVKIEVEGFNVPEEPEKNVASVSALALLKMLKAEMGFKTKKRAWKFRSFSFGWGIGIGKTSRS